jgi:hypothetical protein
MLEKGDGMFLLNQPMHDPRSDLDGLMLFQIKELLLVTNYLASRKLNFLSLTCLLFKARISRG